MAQNNEILLIEELENNYNVNEYTIRYDSNTKRFFKGFAPKVGYGALTSVAVFAGLSIATIATGGIAGLAIGATAGMAVGVGAVSQAIYSGAVYGKNLAKSRFKNLGIGGVEDGAGTIDLVEECERQASELTKMLEAQPNTKEFVVDGEKLSRRQLKKIIKENEDIAYHGLKYLLEIGLKNSDKINYLRSKEVRSEGEEIALDKRYELMDRIALCTKNLASQRTTFNPYKNLIVEHLNKGCLLGFNDKQNTQIRVLANKDDKNEALKMYSNMYETPLRRQLIERRKQEIEVENEVNAEYKQTKETIDELIKHDGEIAKIKSQNRGLAKSIKENNSYYILITLAQQVAQGMPTELKTERTVLYNTIKAFKDAIEVEDIEEIDAQKATLDQLVNEAQNKINMAYYQKGNTAERKSREKLFKAYQRQSEQLEQQIEDFDKLSKQYKTKTLQNMQLEDLLDRSDALLTKTQAERDRAQSKYAGAVQRGWNERAKKNQATKTLNKSLQQLEEQNKQVIKLENALEDTEIELNRTQNNTKSTLSQAQKLHEQNARLNREKQLAGVFLDGALDEVDALNKTIQDKDEQLNKAIAESTASRDKTKKLEKKKKNATSIIRDLVNRIRATEQDLDKAVEGWYESDRENKDLYAGAKQLEQERNDITAENKDLKETVEKTNKSLASAKRKNTTLTKKVATVEARNNKLSQEATSARELADTLLQNNQTLSDYLDQYTQLASERLDRIAELTIEKGHLQNQALHVAHDLHTTKKELNATTAERDMYKQGVADLEDEKATLETKLATTTDELDDFKSKEASRTYNRDRANIVRNFNNFINKVDAHVQYTIDTQPNYDVKITDYLSDLVESARAQIIQDQTTLTAEDIAFKRQVIETMYNGNKNKLARISVKKLNELAKDVTHTPSIFGKK